VVQACLHVDPKGEPEPLELCQVARAMFEKYARRGSVEPLYATNVR
jgi:hypothetical protein